MLAVSMMLEVENKEGDSIIESRKIVVEAKVNFGRRETLN
jgi:diphthamide biosynthesis methyltransferase